MAGIGLYQPGETRMATYYRMLDHLETVMLVLKRAISHGSYSAIAQKAMKASNDQRRRKNKPPKYAADSGGILIDEAAESIDSPDFWKAVGVFLDLLKPAILLLRMVDSAMPCLSKVYYSCCVVDKCLRIVRDQNRHTVVPRKLAIFRKRWKRWHRPFHTAAYAFDPAYQAHKLTQEEQGEVEKTLHRLYPKTWVTIKSQFVQFKKKLGCFKDPTEVACCMSCARVRSDCNCFGRRARKAYGRLLTTCMHGNGIKLWQAPCLSFRRLAHN